MANAKRKFGDIDSTADEPIDPSDELLFTCLGGGNEVGRSCHIIQYKGKTIMVWSIISIREFWLIVT
jgi:cleavage and polyadenylation specificity factor subunit 3